MKRRLLVGPKRLILLRQSWFGGLILGSLSVLNPLQELSFPQAPLAPYSKRGDFAVVNQSKDRAFGNLKNGCRISNSE